MKNKKLNRKSTKKVIKKSSLKPEISAKEIIKRKMMPFRKSRTVKIKIQEQSILGKVVAFLRSLFKGE